MIQHTHLTAWQTHAPWPKRSQIEQDLRLSRGVAAIFADPVLGEHLAMRGGTVLHKAHLVPAARYSEDIDLVLVKAMDTETLDRHLRRVLAPVLGQPADSLIADAWLAIRNAIRPSRILRTAYRFVPVGLRREETIKVEVNLNESASLYPLVSVELDTWTTTASTSAPSCVPTTSMKCWAPRRGRSCSASRARPLRPFPRVAAQRGQNHALSGGRCQGDGSLRVVSGEGEDASGAR